MKNYITPNGFARLRAELKKLLYEDRPEIVRVVSWAASNGDRSENGDYIYGKRKLREIDRRIRFLSKRLEIAEVVDPNQQPKDRVLFGATVRVLDESGAERALTIVGVDETEPAKGQISWTSPMGKALLGKTVGDTIKVETPRGEQEWEIAHFEYRDHGVVVETSAIEIPKDVEEN